MFIPSFLGKEEIPDVIGSHRKRVQGPHEKVFAKVVIYESLQMYILFKPFVALDAGA